jgi:hypothetical protein
MKLLYFLFFFIRFDFCFGQFQEANWCFSDSAGINFEGSPSFFTSSFTPSLNQYLSEPVATISDSIGNLLFYTNGNTVWNGEHNIMSNGSGLLSNNSITQGALITPYPENDSLYFIFYFDLNVPDYGFYYSIVNMNLDNGNGAIENNLKNIKLFDGYFSEKLCGIRHGNGADWWILIHDLSNNKFIKFIVTSAGVSLHDEQYTGSIYPQFSFVGELTASDDGSKICAVTNTGLINLFDFDRCAGELSNFINLTDLVNTICYSCAFSPNGTKLYISCVSSLFQFDLNDSFPTGYLLWDNPFYNAINMDSSFDIGQMELAFDEHIYIAFGQYNSSIDLEAEDLVLGNLSVINSPDSSGVGCDFVPFSFNLEGRKTAYGLPNMPNYNLGALEGSPCDTVTSVVLLNPDNEYEVKIYPNPAKDNAIVNYNLKGEQGRLILYNVFGAKIADYTLDPLSSQMQISVSNLPSGVYLYSMESNNVSFSHGKISIIN